MPGLTGAGKHETFAAVAGLMARPSRLAMAAAYAPDLNQIVPVYVLLVHVRENRYAEHVSGHRDSRAP
jgi:hypothetical protein